MPRTILLLALALLSLGPVLLGQAHPGGVARAETGASGRPEAGPRVLQVGPMRALRRPSEAAAQIRDGDKVEIDAGTYADCAVWRASRIVLRAVGGTVHLAEKTCAGKGIWVIEGDEVTVEGIRFSGAAVPDRNGAGIRATGGSLTVRDSIFERNEMAMLVHLKPGSRVLVENSRFVDNGRVPPGIGHGIYLSQADELIVRGSEFFATIIGHHIKSRAASTVIVGNRIEDGAEGTASYLIDVPNGGDTVIENNVMQKGPRTDNPTTAISLGAEGVKHPATTIRIVGNRFLSTLPNPTIFVRNGTPTPAVLAGNRLCGLVEPLQGPGEVRGAVPCR